MQNSGNSGERVDHDQHIQLFHRRFHFRPAGLRVRRVTPKNHGADFVRVVHVFRVFQNTIDPARYRNTGEVLKRLFLAVGTGGLSKLIAEPFAIFFPNARPMGPCTFGQAIVAW